MRLEDLTIALRPRQPWEAADLGCALVRRDYLRLLTLWFITVVPVWIILGAFLWDSPGWFSLAVWWLKPLYDRLPLFHLSRAAFGAKPSLKETLREWPRLWSRFLFSALLWRRFSFIRSFALPVWMLEGQRGRAVSKRVQALALDGGSIGLSVTAVFLNLEVVVMLGLIALLSALGPTSGLPNLSDLITNPESFFEISLAKQWLGLSTYLAAITFIEPFYVGAGFGLYLNSRIKIEGWDIELTFRRLAARLRSMTTVVSLIILAFLVQLPVSGQTQENAPLSGAEEEPVKTELNEILARPEFKEHSRTQKVWVSEREAEPESNSEKDSKSGGGSSIGSMSGNFLGVLFYCLAGGIVAFFLYLAAKWLIDNQHLFKIRSMAGTKPQGPRVLMGMDITRESLPDDIVSAARSAWSAGQLRHALSLLYRGALSSLVEQRNLPIRDSDTEDDCLHHVAKTGDTPVTNFFRQLTLLWVRAAYAGQEAEAHEFEQLCQTWPFIHDPTASSRRQRVIVGVTLALLALPTLTGCRNKGHWEEETTVTGYQGKARTDPFLAAQYLLQANGHETERMPTILNLPDSYDGVIFVSGESSMAEARAHQLLNWVSEGGHLVYCLAGCAPYNDWSVMSSLSLDTFVGNEDLDDPLLDELNLSVERTQTLTKFKKSLQNKLAGKSEDESEEDEDAEASSNDESESSSDTILIPTTVSQINSVGETFEVEFPDLQTLSLKRPLVPGESVSGTTEAATTVSLFYGAGQVTVINHARPLRNRYLDEKDHARWLLALVGEDPRVVYFIVTLQGNFWALLWSRAWMPVIGLALLIIIWLWMSIPRFGPLQQVELHATKHFVDHIQALGQFFFRLHRSDILLAGATDALRAKLIRLHPHLKDYDDEIFVQMLADRCPLPKERIRAAFQKVEKGTSHEVFQRLQDLQTLRAAMN